MHNKLNRAVAIVLTVAFLGFIAVMGVMTAATGGTAIMNAARRMDSLSAYLPERWDAFDLLQARVSSVQAALPESMWLKTPMGYANSGFQYALGKRMINTGSQNMVTLTTGHLYDLMDARDMHSAADEVIALRNRESLARLPFLFVYIHPTLYDDAMLPIGYDALDHSAEMADEVTALLREGGIEVMDSRDLIPDGQPLADYLLYTDQHWSALAALTTAHAVAERLNAMTGAGLDASLLELDQFNTLTHEKLFMGKYGQRVGPGRIDPDDITEYWPKYDTHISRVSKRIVNTDSAEGDFRTAVTRFERLEPDPGQTWNTLAYTYYGQVESYILYENENAPDYTILLLKDSYSAAVGTFLSLVARHVVILDPRADESLDEWVEKWQPDAVVMGYSLQMLRKENYAFN